MAAGDRIYWSDIADLVDRPLVRLIQQSAQTISHNTDTALLFAAGSEDIDTNGYHSTAANTSRITPTVAGYHRFRARVVMSGAADYTLLQARLSKNGSVVPSAYRDLNPGTSASAGRVMDVEAILSANGSTDYFEVTALHTNGATASRDTSASGSFASTFECEFLRPL